jgi:hypothetical protein
MKLFELHEFNWATRDNAEYKQIFDSDDVVQLMCNIEDVVNNMHSEFKLDLDSELGGRNSIGERLPKAKNHFTSGGAMDLPEVGYNDWSGTVDFGNGRHRTVAAYQLGKRYIPMFVAKDGLDEFKKLVRTK